MLIALDAQVEVAVPGDTITMPVRDLYTGDGILQLIAFATGSTTERGWALLSGLLTVLGGVAVLVFPDKTLVLLAQVTGVILLVFGVSYLLSGVARGRARSLQG